MKLRNGQLNSVGFSLVELSVVTLVLAIVGVGSSTVFINILKNKVSSEAKLGVIYYQDAVVETLAREVTQLAKLPDPVALSSSVIQPIYDTRVWSGLFANPSLPGGTGKVELIVRTLPANLAAFRNKLDLNVSEQSSFNQALGDCLMGKPVIPRDDTDQGNYMFCVTVSRSGKIGAAVDFLNSEANLIEVRASLLSKILDHRTKIFGPFLTVPAFWSAGIDFQQIDLTYRILWKTGNELAPSGKFKNSGFYELTGEKMVNINEMR
ncbi:MAG: hypothetical protein EBQ85_01395 [Proteobacteria bacterium]|nr:hypothetical protein [Pseudomonadota bacterium]